MTAPLHAMETFLGAAGVTALTRPDGFLTTSVTPFLQACKKLMSHQRATTTQLYGELDQRLQGVIQTLASRHAFHLQTMTELGQKTPFCVLLFGEPGTGKTLIARTMADRLHALYIEQSGSDFLTSLQSGGVQAVKNLFTQARAICTLVRYLYPEAHTPVVLCIDEIDRILLRRGEGGQLGHDRTDATTQFLTELTNPQNAGILVVGTTNRIETMDIAALRSGRMGSCIVEVKAPDEAQRKTILNGLIAAQQRRLKRDRRSEPTLNLDNAVAQSDGLVSSDLVEVVRRAYAQCAQEEIAEGRIIQEVPRIASAKLKMLLSMIIFFGGGYQLYKMAGTPLIRWCQDNGLDYYLRKFLREPLTEELIKKVAQGYKERTVYAYRGIRNLIMLFGWKFIWPLLRNAVYHKTTLIPHDLITEPTEAMLLQAIREIKEQKAQIRALQGAVL